MSRTVREPSPQEQIQQAKAGIDGLSKRPAPKASPMAVAYLNALETAVGATRRCTWDTFVTTDRSVFATSATNSGPISDTVGNAYLRCAAVGFYWVMATVRWATPTVEQQIDITGYGGVNPYTDYTASGETTITTVTVNSGVVEGGFFNDPSPGYFDVLLLGGAGSDGEVDLGVWYQPTAAQIAVF